VSARVDEGPTGKDRGGGGASRQPALHERVVIQVRRRHRWRVTGFERLHSAGPGQCRLSRWPQQQST
jgi:hypothetical protein